MIRRLALTAGFAILGAVAFVPEAQAQNAAPSEETIMFTGTVGAVCTFSDTNPGTLGEFPGGLTTDPQEGGTSGETTVTCTGDNNDISVAAPRRIKAPANFQGSSEAFISYNQDTASSNGSGPSFVKVPAGEATLQVNMEVDSNGPLLPGAYEYEVTLTAVSN